MVACGASLSSSSPSSVFPFLFSSYFLSFLLFVLPLFLLLSPFLFSPLLCSPPALVLPCFYRQKTGEKEDGVATMLPPLQHVESFGQVGVLGRRLFDALEEEKSVKTKEEKNIFPLFRVSRGRRRPTVPFKMAPFRAFFFIYEQCMKWRCFGQNTPFRIKHAVSFKRKRRQKLMSKSKLVFNL